MDAAITQEVLEVLKNRPDIRLAILFGSLASDRGTNQSDLDLLLASRSLVGWASHWLDVLLRSSPRCIASTTARPGARKVRCDPALSNAGLTLLGVRRYL